MFGVWYYMRTNTDNTFSGMTNWYKERKYQKLAFKHNLDLNLLQRLIEKRQVLQSQIADFYNRLVQGAPLA